MWCCFSPNTVLEPTNKPLATEVPVVTKPVTLMFRLPSEDKPEPELEPQPVEVDLYENLEEVPVVDNCNTYSLMVAAGVLTVLYLLMNDADKREL